MNIKLWILLTTLYFGSATCLQVAESTDSEIAQQQLLGYLLENQELMRRLVDDGQASLDYYAHCIETDAEGKQHYHPTEFDAFVSDHPLVRAQYAKDYAAGIQNIQEIREKLLRGAPCIVDEPERKIRWNIIKEITTNSRYQPILQEACAFYGITEPIAIFEGTQTSDEPEDATACDSFICMSSELHGAPYGYLRGAIFHEVAHIRHHDRALEHILLTVAPTEQTINLFTLGKRFVERRNDALAFHATHCVHCMFEFSQCSTSLSRTAATTSRGYLSAPDIWRMLNQFFHAGCTCQHHTTMKRHKSIEPTAASRVLKIISELATLPIPKEIRPALWRELCASLQRSCGHLIEFDSSDPSAIELSMLIEFLPEIISQQIRVIDISRTSMLTAPQTLIDQITNINVLYVNARQRRGLKLLGENSDLQIVIKKD